MSSSRGSNSNRISHSKWRGSGEWGVGVLVAAADAGLTGPTIFSSIFLHLTFCRICCCCCHVSPAAKDPRVQGMRQVEKSRCNDYCEQAVARAAVAEEATGATLVGRMSGNWSYG